MEPFKNIFNQKSLFHIIAVMEEQKIFKASEVLAPIIPKLDNLELKQRVTLIKNALKSLLPLDPHLSFPMILSLLPDQNNKKPLGNKAAEHFDLNQEKLTGFLLWPFSEYIAEMGIEHLDLSMNTLKSMTKYFSSEFSVRCFIERYGLEAYQYFYLWLNDDCEHVRRLCSEGTRPRLPWGIKLDSAIKNPHAGIHIIEKLKLDQSLYVRKSIANHLNDISKDNPEIVITIFKNWLSNKALKNKPEILWIIKTGARTLVKKGNKIMLGLLGFEDQAKISLHDLSMNTKKIKIGETLILDYMISNKEDKSVKGMIDYKILYARPSGKYSQKIYKGKSFTLDAQFSQKQQIKIKFLNTTIRTLYSGVHEIILFLNGNEVQKLKINVLN